MQARPTFIFTVILIALLPTTSVWAQEQQPPPPFDTLGWLGDFRQLKAEMASHYANLEWAVEGRRMDLAALSAETEAALRAATSDAQARAAFNRFIYAFGDGHLEIRFPTAAATTPSTAKSANAPASVCARSGHTQRAPRIRIPFQRLAQFTRIDNDDSRYFPLGILTLPSGKLMAVIRIASFEDNVFIDMCERAAAQLSIAADSSCGPECESSLGRATSNLITEALTRQIRAAQTHNIDAMLVDITHNGGGTNWVEAAARVFTRIALKGPRMGFVRHDHHVRQFADKLAAVRSARPTLPSAITTLEEAKTQAAKPCDRSPLWEGKPISCSGLVREPALYATGVLNYAKPTDPALFSPSRFQYQEGVYRGKLYVLIDRETASAAEYFAALLKDNGAAVLLGEATYGAGCGYTNGGIPTTLKFSQARVKMPDCVRYRADGTNEVDGIIPDVLVPWRVSDSEFQRADKVLRALSTTN